jgi:hypothetical protein
MASLLASLPQPRQHHAAPAPAAAPAPTSMAIIGREPPPYPKRAGFVPRKPEDFGDGGAYPEVHVAQYPLDMGRGDATRSGKTLAVSVGVDGEASYEAILRQGSNRDKIIHSDHKAIVPKLDLMDPKVRRAASSRSMTPGAAFCVLLAARKERHGHPSTGSSSSSSSSSSRGHGPCFNAAASVWQHHRGEHAETGALSPASSQ